MSCKPTVGEVRKCICALCAGSFVRLKVPRGMTHVGSFLRIVEVAPKNRARVTVGPAWMGAR